MEERSSSSNVIIAVILSVVVLLTWDYFFKPKTQKSPDNPITQQSDAAIPSNTIPALGTFKDITTVLNDTKNRLTIDTPAVHGSIDLVTGRFDDLTLKNYDDTLHSNSKVRLLAPGNTEHGFFAEIDYTIADADNRDVMWHVIAGDLQAVNKEVTLTKRVNDIEIIRKIVIDDNYMFQVSDSLINHGNSDTSLTPYGLVKENDPVSKQTDKSYVVHTGFIGHINGSVESVAFNKIKDDTEDKLLQYRSTETSTGGWVGMTDKYWATILIPDKAEPLTMRAVYNPFAGHDGYQADYTLKARSIKAGETITLNNKLFAGAKSVDLINHYSDTYNIQGFDFLIDWGWFWFFTRPIFKGLVFFHSVVGNYGIAILILTLSLKTLFFPLANKSYTAMSRMKKLQPEMEKIREKHASDPMAQQQELIALYKREKVNPVAGCWPMLLQIPVFFALYKVLNVALELRHQPFFGWIHDLAATDPTNIFTLFGLIPFDMPSFLHIGIWPLLMGVTMWMQQRLNPAPTDPVQAKMMSVFPFVFTFILAPFASGLVIYWTWNNILSIIQQALIMKRLGVPVEFRFWKKETKSDTLISKD
jgi:YidC/Oxa1 family membrane protein insertase